jgi:hypothetical protein
MVAMLQLALAQSGLKYFDVFVNALSFTLSITAVQQYVTSNTSELITLVCTIAVLAAFFVVLETQISDRFKSIRPGGTARLLAGPVGLLTHLLRTTTQVLVNFLSVTVGRWVMTLTPTDIQFWDTVTAVLLGVSLLWFVGISVGLMRLPEPDAGKTRKD